jgi:hypothetical protein
MLCVGIYVLFNLPTINEKVAKVAAFGSQAAGTTVFGANVPIFFGKKQFLLIVGL